MAEASIDTEEGSDEEHDKEQDKKDIAFNGEASPWKPVEESPGKGEELSGKYNEEPSEKSSAKNKDPFLTETKYVVLNFMSLVPPDLYHNHLSSSPESAISDMSLGDSCNRHFHPLGSQYKAKHLLTKSRSFDVPVGRKVPKLKHLSHLSSLQDAESPASEDNLSYRYRQYLHDLEQQSIPENTPYSPEISNTPEPLDQDLNGVKSQSALSLKSGSPGSVSPRKTPHSLSRWCSDISSSGDFSYASDADDEEEDLSNASSQFSNRSACLRGRFLDLRRPSPRLLSTVTSQSEMELDGVDGLFSSTDGIFPTTPPVTEEHTKQNDIDDNAQSIVIDVNENKIDDTQNTNTLAEANNEKDSTKMPSPRQESPYKKQHSNDSTRSHSYAHLLWSHDQHGSHDYHGSHVNHQSHDQHGHHHHHHPVAGCSQDAEGDDNDERRVADRSKLKLDIPTQVVQLDDILVSLQTDLNSEITDLESEFEEALRSSSNASGRRHTSIPTPLTPQTEAARILARIGDEVRDQYGSQITAAVNEIMLHKLKELTYKQFKEIAKAVIDENLPGWRQVALLMVFGQKMVWKALEKGQKQFGGLVDFSAQLVADVAADFIIREGGWGAVMNFDPSQSSDSQSSAVEDKSPSILDYFSSHNLTQVESGDLREDSAGIDSSSPGTNVDTGEKSKENTANHIDGSGEPMEQGTDNGNEMNGNDCDDLNDVESMDGVFDENTNENAQNEGYIEDQNRLSLSSSGRNLIPSLGFEYIAQNEPQSGRSNISSAGFQSTQTDYVHEHFDFDEGAQKFGLEQNQENRAQNEQNPKATSEVINDSYVVSTLDADETSVVKHKIKYSGSEIDSGQVIKDEISSTSVDSTSNTARSDDIDNHNTHDNQTVPDKTIENSATAEDTTNKTADATGERKDTTKKAGDTTNDTQDTTNNAQCIANSTEHTTNNTKDTTKDIEDIGIHSENVSDRDNHWYTVYRRLGYGAVGMSLGVLALGLAIRQMR